MSLEVSQQQRAEGNLCIEKSAHDHVQEFWRTCQQGLDACLGRESWDPGVCLNEEGVYAIAETTCIGFVHSEQMDGPARKSSFLKQFSNR